MDKHLITAIGEPTGFDPFVFLIGMFIFPVIYFVIIGIGYLFIMVLGG